MHTNTLMEIADSFDLKLFIPINQDPTWYVDNPNDSNSVINLMFLKNNSTKINNHHILPKLQSSSDHNPLIVNITTEEEFIQDK